MSDIEVIANAVPKKALNQLTKTVCEIIEKITLPLTATTEGVGHLIQTRFETLNEHQKLIAVQTLKEAEDKAKWLNAEKHTVIKPLVVYAALESADQQSDKTMSDLWSNLLAREFTDGGVHPEIAKVLSKLTAQDALLLSNIADNTNSGLVILTLKTLASKLSLGATTEKRTFNHVYLKQLGLIDEVEQVWHLTTTGREFMRCVSDTRS